MSWQEIPGWFSSEYLYALVVQKASKKRASLFVEHGVALGRSIACLARMALDSKKPIAIHGIDPWLEIMGQEQPDKQWIGQKYANAVEAFEGLMAEHAPAERALIVPRKGFGQELAREYADGSIDFVMIDGSHDYERVAEDIAAWRPKVRPGGILAGDDFSHDLFPGVVRAVQEAFFGQTVQVRGVTWWTIVGDQ